MPPLISLSIRVLIMLTLPSGMTYRKKTSDLHPILNYTRLIAITASLTPKVLLASLHRALCPHPRHELLVAKILK